MEKGKDPDQETVGEGIEQARTAIENYLLFFQNSMSASPWAGSTWNKKLADYAQQNLKAAFDHAQRLSQAKDFQEVAQVQTEFFQRQLKSLADQAKDLGETIAQSATAGFKGPPKSSS